MSILRAPSSLHTASPNATVCSNLDRVLAIGFSKLQITTSKNGVCIATAPKIDSVFSPAMETKTPKQSAIGVNYSDIDNKTTGQIREEHERLQDKIMKLLFHKGDYEQPTIAGKTVDIYNLVVLVFSMSGGDDMFPVSPAQVTFGPFTYLLNLLHDTLTEALRMQDPQTAAKFTKQFAQRWRANIKTPRVDGLITQMAKQLMQRESEDARSSAKRYFEHVNEKIFDYFASGTAAHLTEYLSAYTAKAAKDAAEALVAFQKTERVHEAVKGQEAAQAAEKEAQKAANALMGFPTRR